MRIYEFTPQDTTMTKLAIEIYDDGDPKVSTDWRDYARNLQRTETEGQKFQGQLKRFWQTVCRIERKYRPGSDIIEKILNSISDPDLKEFLTQNS